MIVGWVQLHEDLANGYVLSFDHEEFHDATGYFEGEICTLGSFHFPGIL